MPLLYQKYIKREHLRANPQVLFVFGDNYLRKGFKGQAKEMNGEPNAVGVATKWKPASTPDSYFSDRDYDQIIGILQRDLTPVHEALCAQRIVVWPVDGIGTGYSRLPRLAPRVWGVLEETRVFFETL